MNHVLKAVQRLEAAKRRLEQGRRELDEKCRQLTADAQVLSRGVELPGPAPSRGTAASPTSRRGEFTLAQLLED